MTDEDIRLAIQNATGPRSSLFVPEVSFSRCYTCLRITVIQIVKCVSSLNVFLLLEFIISSCYKSIGAI